MTVEIKQAKQNAYASDVMFSFFDGAKSLPLDIVPVKRKGLSEEARFPLACPECENPVSVKQQYVCTENEAHGPYPQKGLLNMRSTDDGRVWVNAEQIAEVKVGDEEAKQISFSIHHADEVLQTTIDSGTTYRVRPSKNATKGQKETVALITRIVDKGDVTMVGSLVLKGSRDVYRLGCWQGQLALFGMILPEDLAPTDLLDLDAESSKKVVEAEAALGDLAGAPFDSAVHYRDILGAVEKVLSEGTSKPATEVAEKEAGDDLLAFVNAGKPKKAAAKKKAAPKKKAAAKKKTNA